MSEIKCPFCKKIIEPSYEDGRTTVPNIYGGDSVVDMGSWWYCPKCDEELDFYAPDEMETFDPEFLDLM